MGYNTTFQGSLDFCQEVTGKQLAALDKLCGQDVRDHPEWREDLGANSFNFIDLEVDAGYQGLCWNGGEKTYHLEQQVNFILRMMRKTWPDFGLKGELLCQGEDIDDRWKLVINEEGWAERVEVEIKGHQARCPKCGHNFILEESK